VLIVLRFVPDAIIAEIGRHGQPETFAKALSSAYFFTPCFSARFAMPQPAHVKIGYAHFQAAFGMRDAWAASAYPTNILMCLNFVKVSFYSGLK